MPIGAMSNATRKCSSLARSRAAYSCSGVMSSAVPHRWVTAPSRSRRTSVQARMWRVAPVGSNTRYVVSSGTPVVIWRSPMARIRCRSSGWTQSRKSSTSGAGPCGSRPMSSVIRVDQVSRPVATSHSHMAVALRSRAAASLARPSAARSSADSRSVTSIVAPSTRTAVPSSSHWTSVQDCRWCTDRSGCTTRKVSWCPPSKPRDLRVSAAGRSPGCSSWRYCSWLGGVSPAGRPTRRNICSDHTCAPVLRSSSHQASPVSSCAACSRLSRASRVSSCRRREVMSAKAVTTPVICPAASLIGTELTDSQSRSPDGVCTPITSAQRGWPVRRASIDGCSLPGRSRPSAHTDRQGESTLPRPCIWAALRPRICSAAALLRVITPVRSWTTRPSAMASAAACQASESWTGSAASTAGRTGSGGLSGPPPSGPGGSADPAGA